MNAFFKWENPMVTGPVYGLGNVVLLAMLFGFPLVIPFMSYGVILIMLAGLACKVMKFEVSEVSLPAVFPKEICVDQVSNLYDLAAELVTGVLPIVLWQDVQTSFCFLLAAYFGSSLLSLIGLEFALFLSFNAIFLYYKFQAEIDAAVGPHLAVAQEKLEELKEKVPAFVATQLKEKMGKVMGGSKESAPEKKVSESGSSKADKKK